MPYSRIILRLEVKDTCNLVDCSYSAPDFANLEAFHTEPIEPVDSSTKSKLKLLSQEEASNLRGQRKYHSIVIETYILDMSEEADSSVTVTQTLDTDKANIVTIFDDESSSKDSKDNKDTKDTNNIKDTKDTNNTKDTKHTKDKKSGKSSSDGKHVSTISNITKLKKDKISSETDKNMMNHVVRFLSGNPAVEATEGFLHLYKELSPLSDLLPSSHMICMISIPATFCLQDLLKFLGPVISDLEMIKVVKPGTPNEYMALLKFRTLSSTHEFYNAYNNTRFNSIESDVCHLAFVAKIECIRSQEGAGKSLSNAVELPVCAVCLEKMDESVEGILTILCNHSFHTPCMAQCEDTTCPVCRYTQTPIPVAGNKCFQCSNHEDLWICLICGEVGCGRYANGHAYNHFQLTAHTYAMQLGSNRVWDYVGENYVHRLVLNKVDGKLVEVDNEQNQVAIRQEEKIESLSLEYTYLLTSQLESQRDFFESRMKLMEDLKFKDLEELELKLKKASDDCVKKEHLVDGYNKEKQTLDKKCLLLTQKTSKLQLQLEDEQQMNICLRDNQLQWQTKVAALEEKINQKDNEMKDLQEQLRDLMFYLDAKDKLQSSGAVTQEELEEGQIIVQPSSSDANQQRTRKHKKKK